MKKSAMIRARVEPQIKVEAEKIFKAIGLKASEAISIFYHQVKLKKGLPFEINTSNEPARSRVAAFSQAALISRSRQMTPNERLKAFFHQSKLTKQLEQAGRKNRAKRSEH